MAEKKLDSVLNCYNREPFAWFDDIPVFSAEDSYVGNYNRISEDHVKQINSKNENPWIPEDLWREMEKGTEDLIKSFAVPSNKILDVGVGLGRLLSRFSELEKFGMDISKHYLPIARTKNINVCMAKVEDMPYKVNYFDVVVCTDVLEHVIDLNLAIKNIIAVLKPDGYLIVRVPYREDLSPYLSPSYPYEMAHLRNFDENNLRLMFERIFRLKLIKVLNGVSVPSFSLLKYNLPVRSWYRLMRLFTKVISFFNKKLEKKALNYLYYPVEINMVFQKCAQR